MLVALVSGCAVQGKAVEAHFWDPCTELSDQALREAGAKPETKDDAVQFPDWHMCGWLLDTDPYSLGVLSTERRVADFRRNPTKTGFQDANVSGRHGLIYLEVANTRSSCTVGFDTARGSVHVVVGTRDLSRETCGPALDTARRLLPYLPQ
ncbi:MAG: DUF3558 domain-containing protein [Nocardiaceae bacterium]|nr:DUF3558 domain-containing protein [Nocardiaceae bacterium]